MFKFHENEIKEKCLKKVNMTMMILSKNGIKITRNLDEVDYSRVNIRH